MPISPEEQESLEETRAIMADRSVSAQVRESENAAAAGAKGLELDELAAGLERRRADRDRRR